MDENLIKENAALVTLLRTLDRKNDTWISVAYEVERNGSAIKVLNHEIDPSGNHLVDQEDIDDFENGELSLFPDDPNPSDDRRRLLEATLRVAEKEVREWAERGLDFISVLDSRYPNRLRQVADMPPFLFAEGRLIQDELGVSVVGSRKASREAMRFAGELSSMLVSGGFSVIAGLAAGIDTVAHRQALEDNGRTVAFIGTGIMRHYPAENHVLQDEIGKHGLVLSQFWPDQEPTRYTFPMRNASMSGYGVATVVVQAGEHSGTRIQARQAQKHGRPVILRDTVVNETQWGRRLAGQPGVYVASTVDEVRRILGDILNLGSLIDDAIRLDAAGAVV